MPAATAAQHSSSCCGTAGVAFQASTGLPTKQVPSLYAHQWPRGSGVHPTDITLRACLPAQGAAAAMKELGRYIGLFASDEKLQTEIMNYHIIPGKRLTPEQLKDGLVLETRNNKDPLKVLRQG
jgi:hypothetical protein